jgi:hypothetical protein
MTDRCQGDWLCAKVAVFRSVGPPLITASHMLVRSVTRVFHTCGKNCGNSPTNNTVAQFPGEFHAIPAQLQKRRFNEHHPD